MTDVTLTIDGKQVTVPAGITIVDAAKRAGIDIPVFCYHPKLEPAGMCRMCLVEIGRPIIDRTTGQPVLDEQDQPKIQFMPKLETACTNLVSEGMVVKTQHTSEKARQGQGEIVEFLLTSHPLDCPICDKGGECPLQDLTMRYGPAESRFLYDEKQRLAKHVPLGELIWLDRERCIQCGRCIRFQEDIAGEPVIGFDKRGRTTQIITFTEPGFDSIFSGNTTDICPVGALTTADFRFGARPWELTPVTSICSQCAVGCNIVFSTRREARAGGRIVIKRVMPRQNEQVNEIWICDKGRFAHHYLETDRLTKPLWRRDGDLQPTSWQEALDLTAKRLSEAGSDLVILASGRLSNEDLLNLKLLADMAGGQALLYTHMGGGEATTLFGVSRGFDLGHLGAGDVIVVAASDLYEEAPIWWLRVKAAAQRGADLIVANPRQTKLDRYARWVVRYAYGDEAQLVEKLKADSGVSQALAGASRLVIFFGSEGVGQEQSSTLAFSLAQLLQENGHVAKPGSGLIGVWPRPNDQGAWEIGFRAMDDLAEQMRGKGLYIVGADPVGDDPALAEVVRAARFVVVQEIRFTETARLADVVLPAQTYAEREGTFTSGERRVQRFYAALPPMGETYPDFVITAHLAQGMGYVLEGSSSEGVFNHLARTVSAFKGLTYAQLAEAAEQWPITGRAHYYFSGTVHPNREGLGVALSNAAERGEPLALPSVEAGPAQRPQEGEWLAVPVTRAYDRGSTVWPSRLLTQRIGQAAVYVSSATAEALGVAAGESVQLSWNGHQVEVVVRIDETIPRGVLLTPRSCGVPLFEPTFLSVEVANTVRG